MMALTHTNQEQEKRLSSLFHAYDVDNSGRIEKNEFFTICQELQVSPREADGIFDRLDVDRDGTVTLEEFIGGFQERGLENRDVAKVDDDGEGSEGELSDCEGLLVSR